MTKLRVFKHLPNQLSYDDLDCITESSGRRYITPEGTAFPSVTTVLSILNEESIAKWKARVGEEEASRISIRASGRGTRVHLIIEKYIDNDPDFKKGFTPDILESFLSVKPILDERIGDVYAQEAALYSKHLGLAGRVDCVAYFDNKLSIIDFKTSKKPKSKEWITNYFIQESIYAIMWEERTGQPINQLVTIIAVDNAPAQVFIEKRNNWIDDMHNVINEYNLRNPK